MKFLVPVGLLATGLAAAAALPTTGDAVHDHPIKGTIEKIGDALAYAECLHEHANIDAGAKPGEGELSPEGECHEPKWFTKGMSEAVEGVKDGLDFYEDLMEPPAPVKGNKGAKKAHPKKCNEKVMWCNLRCELSSILPSKEKAPCLETCEKKHCE